MRTSSSTRIFDPAPTMEDSMISSVSGDLPTAAAPPAPPPAEQPADVENDGDRDDAAAVTYEPKLPTGILLPDHLGSIVNIQV